MVVFELTAGDVVFFPPNPAVPANLNVSPSTPPLASYSQVPGSGSGTMSSKWVLDVLGSSGENSQGGCYRHGFQLKEKGMNRFLNLSLFLQNYDIYITHHFKFETVNDLYFFHFLGVLLQEEGVKTWVENPSYSLPDGLYFRTRPDINGYIMFEVLQVQGGNTLIIWGQSIQTLPSNPYRITVKISQSQVSWKIEVSSSGSEFTTPVDLNTGFSVQVSHSFSGGYVGVGRGLLTQNPIVPQYISYFDYLFIHLIPR